MSRFSGFIALIVVFLLSGGLIAQEAQKNSFYTVTTWRIQIPEDGSRKEFNQLMKEWTDKIVRNNDKIISERVMRHQSGADSREVVIITEYASWNDIGEAQNRQEKLVEAAWPNEQDRKAFFDRFNKYVVYHSDEIYQESTGLRK